MGPYYITAMVNLLGPVRRLSDAAEFDHPQMQLILRRGLVWAAR